MHPMALEGYGQGAEVYARGRPGFPREAQSWLEQDLRLGPGRTVLELGAGTGKFTQLLVRTGAEVVAVEPVAAMLARLSADLPGVRAVCATAQQLPLNEACADVVICAQSFHWFASADALREIHRVLKPGGLLGLVWNVRDRSVAWVNELSRIVDPHEGDAPRYDDGEWRAVFPAPGFGPLREKSVAHLHTGSAEQVIVQRTASVSFIAALSEADRRVVLDQVRAWISGTPAIAGKAEVDMPYVTRMYWYEAKPLTGTSPATR